MFYVSRKMSCKLTTEQVLVRLRDDPESPRYRSCLAPSHRLPSRLHSAGLLHDILSGEFPSLPKDRSVLDIFIVMLCQQRYTLMEIRSLSRLATFMRKAESRMPTMLWLVSTRSQSTAPRCRSNGPTSSQRSRLKKSTTFDSRICSMTILLSTPPTDCGLVSLCSFSSKWMGGSSLSYSFRLR